METILAVLATVGVLGLALEAVFVIAKLLGMDWPWLWVLSPLWMTAAVWLTVGGAIVGWIFLMGSFASRAKG